VRRGHSDVHDRDIRLVLADRSEQAPAVARLADDIETRLDEQSRDPFAEEDGVVRENDP
jgi:hypothetical protein